jgi:hypothetical protein
MEKRGRRSRKMDKDWFSQLSPAERAEWDEFVKHGETETLPKMSGSAFVMSLVPEGKPDIKFCVELGMAIMLDKPILAVATPGTTVPPQLLKICEQVIIADIRSDEGQSQLIQAI